MAVTDKDTLLGRLQVTTKPISLCWGKPWDFVKSLVDILSVKFPVNSNNQFIVSGKDTPSPDDAELMWARFDNNRNPLGWFAFVKSNWRKFFTVVNGEVRWVIGDSTSIEDGWQLIDDNTPGVDADIITQIKKQYVLISPGRYKYFAVRYMGYSIL